MLHPLFLVTMNPWPALLPAALGAAALYVLLPRPRGMPRLIGAVLAALALLIGGWTLCILHLVPEYLILGGLQYIVLCVYAHYFLTPKEKPEPMFPG